MIYRSFKIGLLMTKPSQLRVMHIISGDLWAGAEVQAFTLLKYLQASVDLHVVLMNDGELASRLRALNIQVTLLPETELSSFAILKALAALIQTIKPHIVHTHRQKENILGGLANVIAFPFSKHRPKSLRTTHGAPESSARGKQKIQVWLDTWIGCHLQSAVIAVSEDLAKKLRGAFPASHIKVVHNGVDCEALKGVAAQADFKIAAPNSKHIGIIGRIEPVKRIDIFIEMASIFIKSALMDESYRFHVIGDGSLRSIMEERALSYGVQEFITFHGHRSDMASCIASLDVIVMCSDHEGTPMTALEALCLGTPIIVHDVGGLHELLHEHAEFLVQLHEPYAYAEKLEAYLAGGFQEPRFRENYSAERNSANVLNVYEDLIAIK
jgi:L-malate glycosyltransferase